MISDKQLEILLFEYTDYDVLICDGAVRSGKTSIETVAFVDWAMHNFNQQRFGICGKTVGSATENIIIPYISMKRSKTMYKLHWKRSQKILEVSRGNVKNFFEVFGGKDEASFMLIQGRTLAGVLLDEVVLQPRSFVEQALARCSVEGARIWFSCNPGNPHHWFKVEWIDELESHNAKYIHFAMTDNPSLSPKTLARYESMYSGVFYDRYIKGLWVPAEGLVYKDFANNTKDYLIDDPIKWAKDNGETFLTIMVGVDFGGDASATKFQATGITRTWKVIALEEEYITGDIDPDTLNKMYNDFIVKVTGMYGPCQTRADSAEQILIRGLLHTTMKNHLRTQVKESLKMPINERIRLALLLMKQKRMLISRRCPYLIKALQTAVYEPDSIKDVRLDDGTSDIDSLDAFEYSFEPHFKNLEMAGFRTA